MPVSCVNCANQFNRVATCQGKVREKQNFLQVRELSGNFEKMSGNFVMTINFFLKMISFLFASILFQALKFLVALSKRSDLSGHCGVCMDVCMYVWMDVCSPVRQFLVRQLSNRKINHILTYTKEFFLTADLA